jgi:hypothetical protein
MACTLAVALLENLVNGSLKSPGFGKDSPIKVAFRPFLSLFL